MSAAAILFVYLFVCPPRGARWDPEDQSCLHKGECVWTARRAEPHSAAVITPFSSHLCARGVSPKEEEEEEEDKAHTTLFRG